MSHGLNKTNSFIHSYYTYSTIAHCLHSEAWPGCVFWCCPSVITCIHSCRGMARMRMLVGTGPRSLLARQGMAKLSWTSCGQTLFCHVPSIIRFYCLASPCLAFRSTHVYDSTYALLAQRSRGMARLSWHHVVEYDFAMFRLYRYRSVKIIVSLRHAWLFRSTSTVSYDVYVLTCWYVGIVWHPLIWLSPKHWSVGSWQRPAPFGTWYGNL